MENKVRWWARGAGATTASKYRGRRAGGGTTRVVCEFRHQRLKVRRGSRSALGKYGMWLHNCLAPSQQVSVSLGFWPRVAVIIEFRHWQWGLGERTRTGSNIARSGAEPRRVRTTEAVFKEYLDGGRHGPTLPMGQRPENQVRGGGRRRDWDYATSPRADWRIRTITLFLGPESEW